MDSNIPPIQPEKKPREDEQAQAEIDALNEQRKLDSDEKRQEHHRREELRAVFARGVRWLVVLAFILLGLALLVVTWHYLAPSSLHWVEDDDLSTVRTVLFSGTLFGFLGLYVRDRVSN